MTAAPNWDVLGPAETDAELARAAIAGDREAFAGIYDRYADRLHDFCVGMLRDGDAAADCVQDTFCTAATRLPQLREADKLRPWLYSIARNEALRRIREQRRETPSDELPDTESHDAGPDTMAARTELADLIAEAAGGLSDRDRTVLELTYRHGLDGADLADALGVSPANATKLVYRLRETVERSLGALLVSRRARNTGAGCPELAAVLDGWDGRFSILMRKRIARHIESCPTCDEERHQLVSPVALLGAAPLFIPAPAWLRESTLRQVELTPKTAPIEHVDDADGRRTRRTILAIALFAATVIASLGLTIAWMQGKTTSVVPADVTETSTQPASVIPSGKPNPTATSQIPAPQVLPPATTTTTAPPTAETSPAPIPVFTGPVPRFEPDQPVSEPSDPPTPRVSEPPTPRTRSSSDPSGTSPPRVIISRPPTAIVGVPTGDPDPPRRTATRRSTGDQRG